MQSMRVKTPLFSMSVPALTKVITNLLAIHCTATVASLLFPPYSPYPP